MYLHSCRSKTATKISEGAYFDTGDSSVAHDLINNPGQSSVDSTNTVGDLGFDASFEAPRGSDPGLSEGDPVDVVTANSSVGDQSYQIADSDGLFVLEFETVDFSTTTDPVEVSIDLFLEDGTGGFEGADSIRIFVDLDGTEIGLLPLTEGEDIDALIGPTFTTFTADLTGG